jgi:molybdate transport system substrate-binding protein
MVAALALVLALLAAPAGEWVVSIASSLEPALREAVDAWPGAATAGRPRLNAGASGLLLQQIRHGAPADLLLSASPLEIDQLVAEKLADADSRRRLASNRLVAVTSCPSPAVRRLEDLSAGEFDRIAVANVRTAPLGRYTRQALEAAGVWSGLEARLIFAENARQALDYVARGEAPVGIVYRTDAKLLADKLCVAFEIAAGLHDPIAYEGVVLKAAVRPAEARAFLDWLVADGGRAVLARHGFFPPP